MQSIQKTILLSLSALFALSVLFIIILFLQRTTQTTTYINPKIWIHKVNSIEKLREVKEITKGVEIDVVFDSTENDFDIYHPPAKSNKLYLNQYLASLNHPDSLGYWLDFKNLNRNNSDSALQSLDKTVTLFHLDKKKIFVESDDPESLKNFKKAGYSVSYYLPFATPWITEAEFVKLYPAINNILKSYPDMIISFNCLNYKTVTKHFPNQKKLLWVSGRATHLNEKESFIQIQEMINDSNVLIILNQYSSGTEK